MYSLLQDKQPGLLITSFPDPQYSTHNWCLTEGLGMRLDCSQTPELSPIHTLHTHTRTPTHQCLHQHIFWYGTQSMATEPGQVFQSAPHSPTFSSLLNRVAKRDQTRHFLQVIRSTRLIYTCKPDPLVRITHTRILSTVVHCHKFAETSLMWPDPNQD